MSEDLESVVQHVKTVVGHLDGSEAPPGWRDQVNCALIDAVFSARARYGTADTGVRQTVKRWATDGRPSDDLTALAAYDDKPADLAELLDNRQHVPGGWSTKAAAVARAASQLIKIDVTSARDVVEAGDERFMEIKSAVTSVKGIGEVTFTYFGMLLGRPDVKADLHIRRFVTNALAGPIGTSTDGIVSPHRARMLLNKAARSIGVDPITLDHAVWRAQRGASRY